MIDWTVFWLALCISIAAILALFGFGGLLFANEATRTVEGEQRLRRAALWCIVPLPLFAALSAAIGVGL